MPEDFDYGYETLSSIFEGSYEKFKQFGNLNINYIRKDGQICMEYIKDIDTFNEYKDFKYNGIHDGVILLEYI